VNPLNDKQLADTIVSAWQTASPQSLVAAAASGLLLKTLKERVAAFSLQVARMMQGKPDVQQATVEESCRPMLTDFPPSADQTPLTTAQLQAVEKVVVEFLEQASPALKQMRLDSIPA